MPRRDLLDLLFLGAIWGAAFLFIRIAVPEFGPLALVEVRVAIAAAMLLALVAARGQLGAFRGHWRALALIGTLNTAVPFALYAYATRSVPAGFAAVLNATVPLFGALLGRLSFKETLGPMRALGLGVGFVGVLVLVSRDLSVDGRPLAIAAALSASLMYALSAHLTRRVLPGVPSVVIAAGSLVVSVVLLAIPAALTWPAVMPSFGAWMATLALAALATGLGYILYFRLLDNAGATGAMAVTYLIPLFGMVWGGIFLGERVTLPMVIGSAFILLGVAITTGTIRALFARRAG
jgi:drug/metabolite transporter (DMT)-like permease